MNRFRIINTIGDVHLSTIENLTAKEVVNALHHFGIVDYVVGFDLTTTVYLEAEYSYTHGHFTVPKLTITGTPKRMNRMKRIVHKVFKGEL